MYNTVIYIAKFDFEFNFQRLQVKALEKERSQDKTNQDENVKVPMETHLMTSDTGHKMVATTPEMHVQVIKVQDTTNETELEAHAILQMVSMFIFRIILLLFVKTCNHS